MTVRFEACPIRTWCERCKLRMTGFRLNGKWVCRLCWTPEERKEVR